MVYNNPLIHNYTQKLIYKDFIQGTDMCKWRIFERKGHRYKWKGHLTKPKWLISEHTRPTTYKGTLVNKEAHLRKKGHLWEYKWHICDRKGHLNGISLSTRIT